MKKILTYSSYYKPYTSGVTVYLERVLNHLSGKADITVLTFPHSSSLKYEEQEKGIRIMRMPYMFRVSKGFISPQSFLYFVKNVRRADVVLLNIPNAEALALALLAKVFGKRIISIYYCDVDLGKGLISKVIMTVLNMSVGVQLRLSEKIIAIEDYAESLSFYKRYKDKIMTTLPPIETPATDKEFLKKLKTEKGKKTWVGFVGRIAREKGIEYLIDALGAIDDNSYELVLVGPKEVAGENQYFRIVMNKLRNSGISFKQYSSLSNEELSAIYESIDVLVLPSVNSTEAFGMVQAEAMLHGTPVVSSDLPGIRLPVKLTGAGASVSPKNAEKLRDAIRAVLKKKFDKKQIAEKARDIFDPQKTYDLFDKLLLGD